MEANLISHEKEREIVMQKHYKMKNPIFMAF